MLGDRPLEVKLGDRDSSLEFYQTMLRPIACVAVAIAWMLAGSPAALPQTAPTTIRFIAAPSDDLLPFWYAQSAGLFRAAGLNVVADKAPSGAVVAQSVVGGAA